MKANLRPYLAALAGIVVSIVVMTVIESLGHMISPPPGADEPAARQAVAQPAAGLSVGAFFFVLAAWLLGTFLGGVTGGLIAGRRPFLYAGIVGASTLIGAVAIFLTMPHPTWFIVVSLVCIVGTAYLAGMMLRNLLGRKEAA